NVDLVLLDVVMPKSSGPETYKKLLTIKPDLPVIFTTGYDVHVETTELDIFKQASVTVLHKPYTKNTLGRKVREVLSSSNKHKSQKCSHAST
ncbi:MAG: response regulator, partial [bacterium]